MSDVEELVNKELDNVTIEDWVKCVKHAVKLQEEDFAKELGRENILEPVVINLQEDSDTDDSETDGEGADDDDVGSPLALPLE